MRKKERIKDLEQRLEAVVKHQKVLERKVAELEARPQWANTLGYDPRDSLIIEVPWQPFWNDGTQIICGTDSNSYDAASVDCQEPVTITRMLWAS